MRGKKLVYRYKTKPYPHQVKALKRLLEQRPQGGAVFAPMRTGKCKIAIDFAQCLSLKGKIDSVLVVCPLSVISVWHRQLRIHGDEIYNLEWKVINYESIYSRQRVPEFGARAWAAIRSDELRSWIKGKRVLIVVDESHKIGNAQSQQAKHLQRLADSLGVQHRVIMTGTPFHRKKKLLIFGQYKFLDKSVFGTSYAAFKSRYARFGGFGGYVLLGYLRQDEFRKKVAARAFVMASVPLVPAQHTIRSFPLEESEEAYAEMAKEGLWRDIEAPNPLARGIRLSQIASGVVRSNGRIVRVGSERERAFQGLLEELKDNGHEKIVVFTRWLPPMWTIGKVGRGLGYSILPFHGGVNATMRERRIDFFQESSNPSLFISQTATGSLGIELSVASVAVFYTLPTGLVDYDQDLARIRLFRDKRTLSYYYLIADGTVDEPHLASLRSGIEFVDVLTRHPDLLNYEVRG
jgi:SNF2 family DNA or RNA helicase